MKKIDPERMARKMADVLAVYEIPKIEPEPASLEEKARRELNVRLVFPAVDLDDLRRRLLIIVYEEHLSAADLVETAVFVDDAINGYQKRRSEILEAFERRSDRGELF